MDTPFCSTDFRVEVPKGVSVDTRTYVGDIRVEGIEARRIRARSHVGNVDVELPKGTYDIDADSVIGGSDIDGVSTSSRSKREVEARTDVGSVDVSRLR